MRKALPILLPLLTVPLIGEERQRPNTVSVVIDSRPDYAEIVVDGKFIGTTPLNYRLTPGVHRIELTRPGYSTWVRDLTVSDEVPTRVAPILQPPNKQKE